MRGLVIGCLTAVLVALCGIPGWAGVWDMDLPYQGDNPQWVKVKDLWDGHWDGQGLDEIVNALNLLMEKQPDTVEPYLWLSKTYYLKARWNRKERQTNFRQAEIYAVKAREVDPGNIMVLKLIVDTLSFSGDTVYILARYGDWIRGGAPLPVAEALPLLPTSQKTKDFYCLWRQRSKIDKGLAAVELLKDMASSAPGDGLTQLWACRAYSYLGLYYTSLGNQEERATRCYQQGVQYGENALKLLPYSVPAHYWQARNLSGWLRGAGMFKRMRYTNRMTALQLFCSRENAFYYYNGPALDMGMLMAQGDWVSRQRAKRTGITPQVAFCMLDLAAMLYPDSLAIPYVKAQLLVHEGKKDEAVKTVEHLLARNPDTDWFTAPENHCYRRMARRLLAEIKGGA
ncbi:MAG: hypothetical protein ABFD81_10335 [Syntrophaceae bacterium]